MKIRFTKKVTLSLALITAYLFNQTVYASTPSTFHKQPTESYSQTDIFEQIELGFTKMLGEFHFPEVKGQVHNGLKHSTTELQATESVLSSTSALPEYKFKVVITD